MEKTERLVDQVMALKRRCQGMEDALRASLGLSVSEYHCLSAFPRGETLSGADLADRLGLSASRLSRVAEGLVQQGHLRRAQEQDDRRVQHYSLTAGGAEIKAKIQGLLDNCEAALQARLSPKARREAERGMAALIAAMAE